MNNPNVMRSTTGRGLMRGRLARAMVGVLAASTTGGAAYAAGDPQLQGDWSPVMDWPVMAIHAHLMPNGKVLAWDASPDDADQVTEVRAGSKGTRVMLWDPISNQIDSNVNTPSLNPDPTILFCSGHAHLPDGRLFTAAGTIGPGNNPITDIKVFDSTTNTWLSGPNMTYARWYPTVTALPNGEMLITSGILSGQQATPPEVFGTNGQMRSLDGASLSLPLYPMMSVAPSGQVLYAGPESTLRYLNPTGAGAWQDSIQRDGENRDYGSHALYDIGKVLVAGGGFTLNSAVMINLNNGTQVAATGAMRSPRRQHNLTVLADGKVLATGGLSSGAFRVDLNASVLTAELWDSATGQWTAMASEQVSRQYHSTALLLPDGRVLSAGGGFCSDCDLQLYNNKNAQVFSPPYLFKPDGSPADRPLIDAAPDVIQYGGDFQLTTAQAGSIARVALVGLASVTHSNNMGQRYVPLTFTANGSTLTVTAPGNANLAPPNYYMLFIVDASGVPSIAKMVRLPAGNQPPPNLPPIAQINASPLTGAAPLNVSFNGNGSSDPEGGALSYQWNFGDGGTATGLSVAHTYTAAGAYTGTLTVTDPAGASASKSLTITVNQTSASNGLTATYFNNMNLTAPAFSRIDPNVNFNWGLGAPTPSMAPDRFSVRWTGKVIPRFSGTYRFYTRTDDGVRLWVNGHLLINKWVDQPATEWSNTISLTANQLYTIRMEFYDNGWDASARLSWSSSKQAKQVIPTSQLKPQ